MPKIEFDFNYMMREHIPNGNEYGDILKLEPFLMRAHKKVQAGRGTGWMQWTELPYNQELVVNDILCEAQNIRDRFDTFVIFGIGGSALGPAAVHQALQHLHYNELSTEKRNGPKIYIEDNIDPERMSALLDVIDVRKTCFNVITKSGNTSETLGQFLIIKNALVQSVGDNWRKHIIATTDANKGSLLSIAKQEGLKTFVIPEGVGGRFSELCPVGLLPAAVCGINIKGLLCGAAEMDSRCKIENLQKNPALFGAAVQFLSIKKGCNISVMMPYADSLKLIADWYVQLWAESLGKKVNVTGKIVHVGQTPVKALGVTDQHSQVQLYTEGPFDKVITFIEVAKFKQIMPIPSDYAHLPEVSFLGGHHLEELIHAERYATEYALVQSSRMNQTIILPEINANTIGQLLFYFQYLTAVMGELLEIDAFNQPGVEEGKIATYALMGKSGFEKKKAELNARPEKKSLYIM